MRGCADADAGGDFGIAAGADVDSAAVAIVDADSVLRMEKKHPESECSLQVSALDYTQMRS